MRTREKLGIPIAIIPHVRALVQGGRSWDAVPTTAALVGWDMGMAQAAT